MSPTTPDRPTSELTHRLVEAARDEAPPSSSLQRALALVDEAPPSLAVARAEAKPRRPSRRWLVWALPAAAVFVGAVAFAWLRADSPPDPLTAEPSPLTAEPLPAATAAATASEIALPEPTASASASALASAGPAPSAIAVKPRATTKTAGPAPSSTPRTPPSRPAGGSSCGCAADDLMCHMRCAKKQ